MRGQGQPGFGLLETLTGPLVFAVLVMAGSKAYRNVVDSHAEATPTSRP